MGREAKIFNGLEEAALRRFERAYGLKLERFGLARLIKHWMLNDFYTPVWADFETAEERNA